MSEIKALLVLAIYVIPFIVIGIVAKRWFARKDVGLSDVQAEADPNRARRPRFLLGIWRNEGRD